MTSKGFIPIRFQRGFPRAKVPPPSARRIAAAERAVRKEAETLLPGFQRDKTAAERLARQDADTERWWQDIRDFRAREWRRVRRVLRALPDEQCVAWLERWNVCYGPKDPAYAMDSLRQKFPGIVEKVEGGAE